MGFLTSLQLLLAASNKILAFSLSVTVETMVLSTVQCSPVLTSVKKGEISLSACQRHDEVGNMGQRTKMRNNHWEITAVKLCFMLWYPFTVGEKEGSLHDIQLMSSNC